MLTKDKWGCVLFIFNTIAIINYFAGGDKFAASKSLAIVCLIGIIVSCCGYFGWFMRGKK